MADMLPKFLDLALIPLLFRLPMLSLCINLLLQIPDVSFCGLILGIHDGFSIKRMLLGSTLAPLSFCHGMFCLPL